MNRKTKKIFLLSGLLVILSIAIIGYYLFNRGPRDVQDSSSIKVSAVELYNAYIKDSAAAQKKYTDKILEVSGEVHDISLNQQQKKIILLFIGVITIPFLFYPMRQLQHP